MVWVVAFAALTGLVLLLMWRSDGRVPDDAYIFFRYARNLADGNGWTYNPGSETSNGATSPLWALVLAGAYLIRPRMESNAWLLYASCLAGAGLISFASLRRVGRPIAGVVAAILIVVQPVVLLVRGMESAAFLLLTAALIHMGLFRRHAVATGFLGGLLILVRPEGAVLLALVAGIWWWRERRIPLSMAVAAVVPLVPWVVFSMVEFGSPVAGTLAAKTAQGESGFFGPPFVFIRYLRTIAQNPWSLLLLLTAGAGAVVALRDARTRTYAGVLAMFVGIHFLLYGLVVRPPAYQWYYALTYFGMAVFAAIAIGAAAEALAAHVGRGDLRVGVRVGVAGVGLLVLGGLALQAQWRGDIYDGYEQAADWLRANSPEGSSVSASEIGVLGWRSDRSIVDWLGLLNLTSAEEIGRGDFRSWLGREEPDYYVQHVPGWDMEEPSASAPWFAKAFRPVFQSDASGWSRVRVFERIRTEQETRDTDLPVVLSPMVADALWEAGASMDPTQVVAVNELLAAYLASSDLQRRFEQEAGTDLTGLISSVLDSPPAGLEAQLPVLESLMDQLDGRVVVTPLAPTR